MSFCYFIAASWTQGVIPQHFQALARVLVARGHHVVYLTDGQRTITEELPDNLQIYSWPSTRPTKPSDFIFLQQLVRKYRPSCLIANFGSGNVMAIVGWLNQAPCRVVWYRTLSQQITIDRNQGMRLKFLTYRKRLVYKLATHIIANGDYTRDDVVKTYGIPPGKTSVFYNSLADPSISRKSREARIFCAGRLDPSKGQDVLIRAFASISSEIPEFRLHFAGSGRMEQEYRNLVAELGIENRVTFLGKLPHHEVLLSMASSAVTIVPSLSEAFGLVNIESMAVSTPVIASSVGSIPEIIRDGVDGFLVPPGDPEALAEKLRIILSNPELRDRMGRNAREGFLEKFEREKNIQQQADWFEHIVRQTEKR